MEQLALGQKPLTKKQKIKELLRSRGFGGAGMSELNAISYRYGSIIHELRKEGHNISTVAVNRNSGHFKYVWMS